MISFSEIETTAKRATKSMGFSWGIAEEVGKNIRMLEMFGLPGIKNLNYYFRTKNKKGFERLNLICKENKTTKLEFCPIYAGLSFLDQVRSLEDLNQIKFERVAYPLIFLSFISRASEIIGKKLQLNIDDKIFLLNYNKSVFSNCSNRDIIKIGDNVTIKFVENKDYFDQREWDELYELSKNTFVEESDSLKEGGAGAGLTDND